MSKKKYCCYISKNKLKCFRFYELTSAIQNIEYLTGFSEKSNFDYLMSVEYTFQREGFITFNKEKKTKIAEQLNQAISNLIKTKRINKISPLLSDKSGFYYIKSEFKVNSTIDHNEQFIKGTIEFISKSVSECEEMKICLVCSIANFSMSDENGYYPINSQNSFFFQYGNYIEFESIFLINEIDKKKNIIYGSPLFLALEKNTPYWSI